MSTFSQRFLRLLQPPTQHAAFEIPLFPLDTVLFPEGRLRLKVFEPRYLEMVSDRLKNKQPFGVSLARAGDASGEPEPVGCLADIVDWDMGESGILLLEVQGGQRFYTESLRHEANGLILGKVVKIAPETPLPLPEQHRTCANILQHLVERLGGERFSQPPRYDDCAWVGYRLAELLPLKRSVRQDMLQMNDSLLRIEILHSFLAQQGLRG